MPDAFVIMPFGRGDMDQVYRHAIVPALEASGLEPKRVDKHTQGGLVKTEIDDFIRNSEVIVADLTYERPNCYAEVGFAMGVGKLTNLILIARQDHKPSPGNQAKIHFDLAGYDILFWSKEDLNGFSQALKKKIQYRLKLLVNRKAGESPALGIEDPLITMTWLGDTLDPIRGRSMQVMLNNTGNLEAMGTRIYINGVEVLDVGTIPKDSFVHRVEFKIPPNVPVWNQTEFAITFKDRLKNDYKVVHHGYYADGRIFPFQKHAYILKNQAQVWP